MPIVHTIAHKTTESDGILLILNLLLLPAQLLAGIEPNDILIVA